MKRQNITLPISAVDTMMATELNGEHDTEFHQLSNGYCMHDGAENMISCLDLNDSAEQKSSNEEEREEEEEERRREEIQRAFREDKNRRNATLTMENATRVIEAMRGVSFGGVALDWVTQVLEDR